MSVSSCERHESAKNLHVGKRDKVVFVLDLLKRRVVIGTALELSQRRTARRQQQFGPSDTEQDRLAAAEQRRPDFFNGGPLFFERGLLFVEFLPIKSAQGEYHDNYRDRGCQSRPPIHCSRPFWLADRL